MLLLQDGVDFCQKVSEKNDKLKINIKEHFHGITNVRCEKVRLKQVLYRIMQNAFVVMDEGEILLQGCIFSGKQLSMTKSVFKKVLSSDVDVESYYLTYLVSYRRESKLNEQNYAGSVFDEN